MKLSKLFLLFFLFCYLLLIKLTGNSNLSLGVNTLKFMENVKSSHYSDIIS